MAVYRPTYRDKETGELRQAKVWWYEFTFAGKRIRESAHTTRRTLAVNAENKKRLELERAITGLPVEEVANRVRSVADCIRPYIEGYGLNHRPAALAYVKSTLKNVERLLGAALLPELTEDRIREYIAIRKKEKAAGRTINAELGELSRAIGHPWRLLWPRLKKLEERRDVGKALSSEDEARLLAAADANRSPNVKTMVRVSLLTGLRAGELSNLTWGRVDFDNRTIMVGESKSEAGRGRQIPMNDDLYYILTAHAEWFTKHFGMARPQYYVFPWGSPYPSDPTRPTVELKTAWESIRTAAGVKCRWHDLRHTVCTKFAEDGVPESTMLALMGHMSRAMLERYSHIRMAAKREAVKALSFKRASKRLKRASKAEISNGVPKVSPKVGPGGLIQ